MGYLRQILLEVDAIPTPLLIILKLKLFGDSHNLKDKLIESRCISVICVMSIWHHFFFQHTVPWSYLKFPLVQSPICILYYARTSQFEWRRVLHTNHLEVTFCGNFSTWCEWHKHSAKLHYCKKHKMICKVSSRWLYWEEMSHNHAIQTMKCSSVYIIPSVNVTILCKHNFSNADLSESSLIKPRAIQENTVPFSGWL